MADEQPKAPSMDLEISVGGAPGVSADFSGETPDVTEGDGDGLTVNFNSDGTVAQKDTAAPDKPEGEEPATEENAENPEEGEEASASALPDYDAANEEVVKAYEDRVFSFDAEGKGSLNMDALSELWEANEGALPDGVYAYLTDATGISKEAVKEIEAGRVALREKAETELYSTFGGKDEHDAAFAWATGEAGYSEDQKARFNEAVKAGGAALVEQMELLKTRYTATQGGAAKPAELRRRVAPRRVASGEASPAATGPQPYADNKAYLADAKAKGFNSPDVRKRLEASSFWR